MTTVVISVTKYKRYRQKYNNNINLTWEFMHSSWRLYPLGLFYWSEWTVRCWWIEILDWTSWVKYPVYFSFPTCSTAHDERGSYGGHSATDRPCCERKRCVRGLPVYVIGAVHVMYSKRFQDVWDKYRKCAVINRNGE